MEILFAFDNEHNIDHFLVNHPNISQEEILEVFANKYAIAEVKKNIYKIVGHTNDKKFLIVVGIYGKNKEIFRAITAYPASKKYIIHWKKEVVKND